MFSVHRTHKFSDEAVDPSHVYMKWWVLYLRNRDIMDSISSYKALPQWKCGN